MKKTFFFTKNFLNKKWYLINAENQILGRLSSQISQFLLNKKNKFYTPFLYSKNNFIIINTKKIKLSKKKDLDKKYSFYSGYPSGLAFKTFLNIKQKNSTKLIFKAIFGMLPKNKLRYKLFSCLHIFSDKNNRHKAQKPQFLNFY